MPVYYLYIFSDDNVSKDRKEGENCGEGSFAIYDEKWDMVDFDAICQISDTCPVGVGVCENDNLVPAVDEFLG